LATFDVAHINVQGQDIIIVPLDREPTPEQIDGLQACATSAGLAGTVCPVWQEFGRIRFIAPRPWHPFFQSLTWPAICANINKKLTCNW